MIRNNLMMLNRCFIDHYFSILHVNLIAWARFPRFFCYGLASSDFVNCREVRFSLQQFMALKVDKYVTSLYI